MASIAVAEEGAADRATSHVPLDFGQSEVYISTVQHVGDMGGLCKEGSRKGHFL